MDVHPYTKGYIDALTDIISYLEDISYTPAAQAVTKYYSEHAPYLLERDNVAMDWNAWLDEVNREDPYVPTDDDL